MLSTLRQLISTIAWTNVKMMNPVSGFLTLKMERVSSSMKIAQWVRMIIS